MFCGANQTKIPLDLAAQLQPLGDSAEYVPIHGTGHNALDFHIAFYIGRLSSELSNAVFYIISKDEGFDPLIQHLSAKGSACHRVASLSEVPGTSVVEGAASPTDRIERVAENLLRGKVPRPRTAKALKAYLKCQLNSQATEGKLDAVLADLAHAGMSTLPDGKLAWP